MGIITENKKLITVCQVKNFSKTIIKHCKYYDYIGIFKSK